MREAKEPFPISIREKEHTEKLTKKKNQNNNVQGDMTITLGASA